MERFGALLPRSTFFGLVVAVLAVLLNAFLSYRSLQTRGNTEERVSHTLEVLDQLSSLLSTVKDAETGQRGFLLTGSQQYLDPYDAARTAIPTELNPLRGAGHARSGPARWDALGHHLLLLHQRERHPARDAAAPVRSLRQSAEAARTQRGLGLGLYIVQQILHAHRGQVEVQSGEGGRTVFRVDLPRRVVEAVKL